MLASLLLSWAVQTVPYVSPAPTPLPTHQGGTDVCSSLMSPRWSVRHDAERALLAAWPWSLPMLKRLARHPDNHLADAAERLLKRGRRLDLDACGPPPRADRLPDAPWIPEKLADALWREPLAGGDGLWEDWRWGDEAYRAVAERWALHALEAGWPPFLIRLWFAAGRKAEANAPYWSPP